VSFDPSERAADKRRAREEDERRLASGEVTREELQRQNSMFGSLNIDWANTKIITKRHRVKPEH
jgi:hypothetical protein